MPAIVVAIVNPPAPPAENASVSPDISATVPKVSRPNPGASNSGMIPRQVIADVSEVNIRRGSNPTVATVDRATAGEPVSAKPSILAAAASAFAAVESSSPPQSSLTGWLASDSATGDESWVQSVNAALARAGWTGDAMANPILNKATGMAIDVVTSPVGQIEAHLLHRFAAFNPAGLFADALAAFAGESASMTPVAATSPVARHRAWIVTALVVGIDAFLAARWYAGRWTRRKKQTIATIPGSEQAGPLPSGLF